MQESGRSFTIKSLKNLTYLEKCIKETMRLYPVVPFISRIIGEDVKLRTYLIKSLVISVFSNTFSNMFSNMFSNYKYVIKYKN